MSRSLLDLVEDTYVEAFRSVYAAVLITARDKTWLDHAVTAVTGHASSTIMCDCEAGLDRYVYEGTPDGRIGAIVQFHVPKFRKDHVRALELTLIRRLGQDVLTCPTAAVWNVLPTTNAFPIGRKLAYFGDGYEERAHLYGRDVWCIPVMGGTFLAEATIGYADGLMGGMLWLFAEDLDAGLAAAEKAVEAIRHGAPGVIMPFPGGITWSGSKAGSRYKFLFASTNHPFCPTLRDRIPDSRVPEGVTAVLEIIINGESVEAVARAMRVGMQAVRDCPGLVRISAGNYGGRLGKTKIYLRELAQAAEEAAGTG